MYVSARCAIGDDVVACVFDRDDQENLSGPGWPASFGAFKLFPRGSTLSSVLSSVVSDSDANAILVSSNQRAQLDGHFLERLAVALKAVRAFDGRWALATPGGLDLFGRRQCAMYSSTQAAMPIFRPITPINDTLPDLYVLNRDAIFQYLSMPDLGRFGFSTFDYILSGYINGLVSVFCSDLSIAIDGPFLPIPTLGEHVASADRFALRAESVMTLAGPLQLGEAPETDYPRRRHTPLEAVSFWERVDKALAVHARPITVSIVVRTRFTREHLLRRLLASLTRALVTSVIVEVRLATDASEPFAHSWTDRLTSEFPDLSIRTAMNHRDGHSRIGNMLEGIAQSTGDFVWIIDDDDYVDLFAFATLRRHVFMSTDLLLFVGTAVHDETWKKAGERPPVLAASTRTKGYPASGWRDLFQGWNSMPICGGIFPRQFLQSIVSEFQFRHDYSEDYTLYLLAIGSSGCPYIEEVEKDLVHVSIRSDENHSVTLKDRSGWTRDTAGYLYDLSNSVRTRTWPALIAALSAAPRNPFPADLEDQRAIGRIIKEHNFQICAMQAEISRLRKILNYDGSKQ